MNQQESYKALPAEAELAALPPLAFSAEELKAIVKQSTEVNKVLRDSMPRKEAASTGTGADATKEVAEPAAKRRRCKSNP